MKEIGHFGVGNSAAMTCLHLYPIGVYRGIACIWAHWLLKLICEQVPTVCWALLGIRGHRKDDKEIAFALVKPVLALHGELQVSDLNRNELHRGRGWEEAQTKLG